jgi:hypothetical protein
MHAQLLECLPRGKGLPAYAYLRFSFASFSLTAVTGCANDGVRPEITASASAMHILHSTADVWAAARWKGSDPGPTDARDPGGMEWPNAEQQARFNPTVLKRWRSLRAAHDILWGDPFSADDDAEVSVKDIVHFPNGIMRRYQDPRYPQSVRVLQYGKEAVRQFLQHHGFSRVIRGHQGKGAGEMPIAFRYCSSIW